MDKFLKGWGFMYAFIIAFFPLNYETKLIWIKQPSFGFMHHLQNHVHLTWK